MRMADAQWLVEDHDLDKIRRGIDDLLTACRERNVGAGLLEAYCGDDPPFTGAHFDTVGDNPTDGFSGDDLAALSLLDVPAPRQLVADVLVHRGEEFNGLLVAVRDNVDLWDADVKDVEAAGTLWGKLKEIDDVGWVTAHKLVARKRPRLHPVYDRVVRRWFEEPDGIRYGLAVVLGRDAGLRETLDAALPDVAGLHLLRRIDIAIWLLGASNPAAVTVRQRLGVDTPPGRS